MPRLSPRHALPLALALALPSACGSSSNLPADGAAPYDGPVCDWSAEAVGLDDDPGTGFTAAELFSLATGERSAVFKWDHSGETTDIVVTTRYDGGALEWLTGSLVDSDGEPWSGGGDTGGDADDYEAAACPAHFEAELAWSVVTGDGRLDAGTVSRVTLDSASVIRVEQWLPLAEVTSSELPLGIDPAEWDSVDIEVVINASETDESGKLGTGGELAVVANRVYSTEDAEVDEGHMDDIGRWPWEG